MSENILSQDEIDLLLNVDTDNRAENKAERGTVIEKEIRPYDPETQRRVIRGRLHSLEIINERFARRLRVGLFNILHRSLDVTVGSIRIQPYHEFAKNLPVMTNLNLIHMKPLRGTALFVFSPHLVFMAVDTLFGGDGRFLTKADGREFTPVEQRIIHRMLSTGLEAYDYAWSSVFSLKTEYVRSELQVKFTNITSSPNDIVVTTPFCVEMGSYSGELDICIPFSVIEPLRQLLVNSPVEDSRYDDEKWRSMLASQVQDTELELVVNFANISTRLSQVMKLKPQDIIQFDKPESIKAYVDGVPILTGKYGSVNNQYALEVEEMSNSSLLSLKKE